VVEPTEPDDDAPREEQGNIHAQHRVEIHPEAVELQKLQDTTKDGDLLHLTHQREDEDNNCADEEQDEAAPDIEVQSEREKGEDQESEPGRPHDPLGDVRGGEPVQEAQDESDRDEWPGSHEVGERDERERLFLGDGGGHGRNSLRMQFLLF